MTATGQNCDGNEAAAEADVKDYGGEGEDGDTAQEAGEANSECGINDGCTLFVIPNISDPL